jgi:hypothetical protein
MKSVKSGGIKIGQLRITEGNKTRLDITKSRRKRYIEIHKESRKREGRGKCKR